MQELDDYINKVKYLPPAPRILPELLQLIRQPDIDNSKIVGVLRYDPALTANILQLCNSAYLGAATPAADLSEAVTRVGFNEIYTIVAALSGARVLSMAQKGYGLDPGDLWRHAVATAMIAQLIAKKQGDDENLAFTAALLHDVGKIVLSESLEHIYAKLVEENERRQQPLIETEKKLLGVQHAEIGGRLLARWKFPANLVAAVWFHHAPKAAEPHHRLAAYIYLANMIAYFMGYGFGHQAFALQGRAEALDILQLDSEHLPHFMIQTFEQLKTVEALFRIVA
ncbi:MAG: HDOD domain-containing protein [Chloroflexi bacterium]|nr:HDOD domain-containing protein [Chloroflexota bacterium]